MIPRFVIAVVIAAVSGVGVAQDVAEFAPADLVLTKRLLVRHKVAELAFLKKDRGLVALANPPAVLQWSAHNRAAEPAQVVEPWAFANRTPIVMDPGAIRTLISAKTSSLPGADLEKAIEGEQRRREQVHVRYIFVPRKPANLSPRNAARHLEKFRRELGRGTPFEALAGQYSVHGSATRGGDLGFVGRGVLPPDVESFAFSAEPGRTSSIIETGEGLHVVRIEERKTPAVESLRAELEDRWIQERLAFAKDASRQVIAVAANARRVAVASGHVVVLYDVNEQTNSVVPAYAFIEPATVDALALTSGGNIIAIAGGGEVTIRRLKQEGLRERIPGTRAAQSLLFSPNAALLAVGIDRDVDVVSVAEGTVAATVGASDTLSVVAFSLDSRTLVTGDRSGRVELWDATTYDRVRNGEPGYEARYWTDRTWRRLAEKRVAAEVRCIAFHPSGRLFVTGLASGKFEAFDLPNGGRMPLGPATPHNASLIRATFSEDGTVLITAAEDDTVGVWAVPPEFKSGPKPRPRTFEEVVAQHREVVRVHAELRTKRDELTRLKGEYDTQARNIRDALNRLIVEQNLPNWRAAERLPEGNSLLHGLQGAIGYRDELAAAVEVLRLSMIDLENIARFQVMEINARRVLQPEQFERLATKLAELSSKIPDRPDPTVAPRRVPSFDRVWQYVLTGE